MGFSAKESWDFVGMGNVLKKNKLCHQTLYLIVHPSNFRRRSKLQIPFRPYKLYTE
jgi:hypothetical protein